MNDDSIVYMKNDNFNGTFMRVEIKNGKEYVELFETIKERVKNDVETVFWFGKERISFVKSFLNDKIGMVIWNTEEGVMDCYLECEDGKIYVVDYNISADLIKKVDEIMDSILVEMITG